MEHEVFVPVPAERLREVLDDPARVARAVPGLQQDAGAEPVTGRLKIRVGSHSVTYRGAVRVSRAADGGYAVEGDATEARGSGSVKLALRIALRDEEGGTAVVFDGTAAADGRIKDLPSDAVEGAVTRLLNRFAEHLAAADPETTTPLATQDFEPRATTDYETTPDADDAAPPPPPPAGAEEGAVAGEDAAPGSAGGGSAGGPAGQSLTAGAAGTTPGTAREASATGPDDKTPASGHTADDARASGAGDAPSARSGPDDARASNAGDGPSAPGHGGEAPAREGADDARAPGAGDGASAPRNADESSVPGNADDARAPAAGDGASAPRNADESSPPGNADEPPVPAADDAPAPASEPPATFGSDLPPSSLGPSDLGPADEDDEADDDIAEAAHARRTMIGRSAEEVDHAPPRGRYAPVPAPQTVMPAAPLRWAAPAAALALASAIVAVRALRRRH
ncbi:SRPBCC domain-containing protein [Streptomyces coeruleorubidus]|uniref:SRPBCC domain-containing protein n=1 Tax=Streptomyces coeruleorubidus TaxID=116188 RepID=UPI003702DBE7